jgi:nickel-dependent lactate racemase
MKIKLPYGKGHLNISLPDKDVLGVLQNKEASYKNIRKPLLKALRQFEIPFRKKKVLIVVPDSTRHAHLKEILPLLIERIDNPSREIDIIIATGLHRRHTPEEVARLVGARIVKRHKILHHDPSENAVMSLGRTDDGVTITLDKAVSRYDLLISVGVVEPHLYAGYSGGAKTIAIGLAGERTINATHGILFLDDPGTGVGSVEGNRFQETLWKALESLGPVLAVNTVNDQNGNAIKVFCGPVREVFDKCVKFADSVFAVKVARKSDIAICGIGYPKDVNLYQASRAMNYVLSVDSPVVRTGGALIIAAELKDGIGSSAAEKRFYDGLKRMSSPEDFIGRIRKDGCVAGEHRAYMVAKAMLDHTIIFVNERPEAFMKGLPFIFVENMNKALEEAMAKTGRDPGIYVIPHSLATIPRQV